MSDASQGKPLQQMTLPVVWHVSDQIQSRYADNIIVQPRRYDMVLSFFESQFPPLGGTPEENRAALEKLGAIRADCVAKIVVAPELLPAIITALQTAYEGYLATVKEEKESTDV